MCADVCIHNPSREQKNIHAHIMLTMRPFNEDGTWGDKQRKEYILDRNGEKIYNKNKRTYKCRTVQTTDWNSKEKAEEWRSAWAELLNISLAERSIDERVDHRSFERQGKEEKPTIHLGVSATQMERKGIHTAKGDINRRIKAENERLREIKKQLNRVNRKIAELSERQDSENLINKLLRYHENGLKFTEARGIKLSTLKLSGKLCDLSVSIAFLQGHNIRTIEEMTEKLNAVNTEYSELKRKVISRQSRMKELAELLNNYENYKPNKSIFEKYESITNTKKKEKFYNAHSSEIEIFKATRHFFRSKLGNNKIVPKSWKSEYTELNVQSDSDAFRLRQLEEDIAVMSTIAYNVDRLGKYEDRQQDVQRKKVEELS